MQSARQVPHLSIVIPALNEAERLPASIKSLCSYLSQQQYAWEIIVVSNGSTDETEQVVKHLEAAHSHVHLVVLKDRGKGRAVRAGVERARGDLIFQCDADLSVPVACLEDFLRLTHDADVVVGSREAPGARRYREPWHRHLMGRVFNRLVQALAVPGIEDTQCGFKAYRREAAHSLFERQTLTGWGFDVELLYLARKHALRIRELGIPWYFDANTRVRPGIDTVSMVWELILIRIRDARGVYDLPRVPAEDALGR